MKENGFEVVYTLDSDPLVGVKKVDVLTGMLLGGQYQIYTKTPFTEKDAVRYLSKEIPFTFANYDNYSRARNDATSKQLKVLMEARFKTG